jgi:hypothetical protein
MDHPKMKRTHTLRAPVDSSVTLAKKRRTLAAAIVVAVILCVSLVFLMVS